MKRREALCVFGSSVEAAENVFSAWLEKHPEGKFVYLEERSPLQQVAWEHLLFDLQLAFSPSASKKEKEQGQKIFEELKFLQIGAEALLSDVKDQGKTVANNIMLNLPFLEGSFRASELSNRFKGVPAIICGAGPSLDRHLPFLREAKNKTLLLAGGSAIKALKSSGVVPHAAAYIDPNPASQLFSRDSLENVPFFFSLRLSPEVLKSAKGPKIWAADGQSYPMERWFTEQLGIEEPSIDAGWNVATFCISLAAMMGCNPIILIGVDLSLPSGQSYAKGVSQTYPNEELVQTDQGVTKKDFILAADWIAAFAKDHPEITLMNGASEAWKIENVSTVSLESLLSQMPKKEIAFDLSSLQPIQGKTKQVLAKWKESRIKGKDLCGQLLSLLESHFPGDPRSSGQYALFEVELEELPIFQYYLKPIWEVWRFVFEHEQTKQEPYPGFRASVQKWLFFQDILKEVLDESL